MPYLKKLIINYINIIIFILIINTIFIFYNSHKIILANENKIIFKINNTSFTSVDLENRKKYLDFIGDNFELNEKEIIEDYISVNLFFIYFNLENYNINLKSKIDEIYFNVIEERNINKNNIIHDEEIIKSNIKLDYIRKIILEDILNSKRNYIFNNNDDNLLYNYKVKYINLDLNKIKEFEKLFESQEFKNIDIFENFLNTNNIEYFSKVEDLEDINKISKLIKNNNFKNRNFYTIKNNNFLTVVSVNKYFKTYDGLIVQIFSVESNDKINNEFLTCKNINKLDINKYKITHKNYEFIKLNQQLKDNLLDINDFIVFTNEDKITYIFLCDIKFNKEIFSNVKINKKIEITVNEVEKKFITEYSKKYNLVLFNE